ncbi:uncharacterized protein LOC113274499 [Papaver somniferum]|uniref:uncharacterized protein LOC113274499 n=1 Tax=Papaver somniferum TaxID=3469 RepID=UPI000E6F8951|nr:uncharacterized protein LOC113274499 [Papaver somniferum]
MAGLQCCQNPPDISLSSGSGCVEEIGGLQSYVSGSLESKLGILLVSDVFGKVVGELAKSGDLKAIVMMHPSLVTVDDIKVSIDFSVRNDKCKFSEIKVPISILGAEVDQLSSPELVKQFEQVLQTKSDQVPSFVKIFNGVEHGWTVRYEIENKEAVEHAEEAHANMLELFSKYVK